MAQLRLNNQKAEEQPPPKQGQLLPGTAGTKDQALEEDEGKAKVIPASSEVAELSYEKTTSGVY